MLSIDISGLTTKKEKSAVSFSITRPRTLIYPLHIQLTLIKSKLLFLYIEATFSNEYIIFYFVIVAKSAKPLNCEGRSGRLIKRTTE